MSTNIEQERQAIDAAIGEMTLIDVLNRNAQRFGSRAALKWKATDGVRSMSWTAYRDQVKEVAAGLITLGVKKGDFVTIMATNRPEHVIADLGILYAGAVPVSVYNTLAPSQVVYIANHCSAKVAIVDNPEFYEKWSGVRAELPNLQQIVVMDPPEGFTADDHNLTWEGLLERGRGALAADPEMVDRAFAQVSQQDLATLVYTSGTTADPKGVMISHYNVLWTLECVSRCFPQLPDHMRVVSYLPLAHVGERMATHYIGLWRGCSAWYEPELTEIAYAVGQHKPQGFFAVPRVWEKFQAGLMARLESEPKAFKRKLALKAVHTALEAEKTKHAGGKAGMGTRFRLKLYDRLVFSKIRKGLGLDELMVAFSAAAPISPELLMFFRGIGIPVYELFGQTESSGPGVTNRPGVDRIGTVGKAMPGVEVELAEDGEVLLRGGLITGGYYRDPETTASNFDEQGWLHTGDLGRWDKDGFLSIVGRKKDIIITAAGKNVAPARMENLLAQGSGLVSYTCVVGDGRRYLTLLVALDPELAPEWAEKQGIQFEDLDKLSRHPQLLQEVDRVVGWANQQVSQVEQVKQWRVVVDAWTPETGEITPSMKLKRRVVIEKYATQIEEMYQE